MTLKALEEKRADLVRRQRKEYQTRGNTERCQDLWAEIEKIDAQIQDYISRHARQMMKGETR